MVAMLLITGISMGLTFRPHLSSLIPFVPLMVLLMLSSAVMLISSMRGYAGLGTAFKILSLLLLGFILTYDNAPPRPTNSVEGKITLTGKVIMAEYMRGDRQRIRLAVLDDNDWPVDIEFDLRLITKKGETSLTPGDVVSGNARINSPLPQLFPRGFDFTAHAYHQGYAATGFLENITIRGHTKAGLASSLRFSIQHNLRQNLNEYNAAIASAVLVGLRSGITPEIREAFRASGLSHLLAISGLHMALFWGSIMALIRTGLALFPHVASRYPSLKLAALLSMPFGVFYLIISGLPISAVRAFLMLALFMLAILLTRRGITLHHVALAAIAILVLDPEQSIITHPFGLSSQAYLGDVPSNAQNLDLIIRQDNTRIAVIWRHHQLDDACAGADLVLVMSPMNVRSCQAVTIGLHNIRAHGGVLVIRDQDMFMLDYVDGFRQQFRAR